MPYTPPICVSVAAFWHREERRWTTTAYIHDPTSPDPPMTVLEASYGPFDTWQDVWPELTRALDELAQVAYSRS